MRARILILAAAIIGAKAACATPVACLIEPDKVAEVGASGVGIIDKISVERGDYVREGQVVAHLKSDVERASVNVAAARAQAEAELKASVASDELSQAKLKRTRELFGVGFVSKDAVEQAEAEARVAKNRVVQAKEAQGIARYELELSHSQLAQRNIRSPFPGIVIDRYRTEGERIEREPVLRIAKVDPLRVEAILSAAHFGQIRTGTVVPIRTDVPGLQELFAKVVLVDTVIDAASNTFRVRLVLPNEDRRIPAGLRCKADFAGLSDTESRTVQPRQSTNTGNRTGDKDPAKQDAIVAKGN